MQPSDMDIRNTVANQAERTLLVPLYSGLRSLSVASPLVELLAGILLDEASLTALAIRDLLGSVWRI